MTRTGALTGALIAAIVSVFFCFDPTFFGYEWLLHDRYARVIARHIRADPRVMIVAISRHTDEALAPDYGRPPYARSVHATVIRELVRAGAAVIAFDLTFAEADQAHPDADRQFATSLKGAPVVLAVDTYEQSSKSAPTEASEFADRLWRISGGPPSRFGVRFPYFRTTPSIGTIRLREPRNTSVYHSYVVADHIGSNRYVPSLALESARMFAGSPRTGAWYRGKLEAAGYSIPVDADGGLAIRWSDFTDQAHLVGFEKVLAAGLYREDGVADPRIDRLEARFKGKIVLIAYTSQGMLDLRATPLRTNSAGVEIHANAIANLISGDFNRFANRWLMVVLMIAIAALAGAAIHGIQSQMPAGIVGVTGVAIWIAGGFLALAGGWIIPTVAGATSTALTYVVITVIKLTFEQRQTAQLRATFGRYVSPQILQHILAHPEMVQLGGERRDLTVLFSDIRGFTSISEANEPEAVVEMLNEYLTKMVEILLDHGGTLDKFIGDAVMGFWNAPAGDPDHARHAVACALEMIEETARIRERWEKVGKASIRIGIGINTGDAIAGNIGAEKVFSYTVIGDAVNLASRLESKNKDYGTEIIISEFTKERIGDGFELVYLDDVKVKGKEKAVRIFEVKGQIHA